jgi:glycosyltransferase involved in cell wall biosynthesis
MQIWLYRRRLSMLSGAGQLVQMQAEGLERAGVRPLLAAERGRLKFRLRTGRRVRRVRFDRARELATDASTHFVDHSASIPEADTVFVHNHAASAARYLADPGRADPGRVDPGLAERVEREAAFYRSLNPNATIVVNSAIVADALSAAHGVSRDRVDVLHPGLRSSRFNPETRDRLRGRVRRSLGVDDATELVGFVTSGNLAKRGIDCFVETARLMAAERSDIAFLVVGASRAPAELAGLDLVRQRRLVYRPRSREPEHWYAALDVFLYPAAWEEFGMVVTEAMASGLPVLTSRRVGAVECLPSAYDDWTLDSPDAESFAELSLRLLHDRAGRFQLIEAGAGAARELDERHYGDRAARLILSRKR